MKPKNKGIFLWVLVILFFCLCAGSLFLTSPLFVNEQITPKWYWTVFCATALLLSCIVFSFFTENKTVAVEKAMPVICRTVVSLCLLQALYGIFQYFHTVSATGNFPITGSFDNPAGFAACLCAGFPFVLYFVFSEKPWKKYLAIATGIILVAAIVLSASRAGIISIIAVCLAVFFYKVKLAVKWKRAIAIALLLVSLSGLYFLKKDSADGRLLIWRCSWEMIKDKPLFGHGSGGFKAHYMNYQANYFETHPDSEYAMLADNAVHPFNEYLLLVINYGLTGFALLLIPAWFLWKSCRKNRENRLIRTAFRCLLSIAVFSFFSYPLKYPFVWITGISGIAIILWQAKYSLKVPKIIILSFQLILIPVIVINGAFVWQQMSAEIFWKRIANKSLAGKTEEMLPIYEQLHKQLNNNELFLYNYTAELNVAKRYDESLQTGRECERLLADYDLQMLLADNYLQLKQYGEAEKHYIKASRMCPARFMPLYELAKMYAEANRDSEALAFANTVLTKKIKVSSPTVSMIRNEMRRLIKSINDKQQKQRQEKVSETTPTETLLPP
jgi:O-antigen ligase